MSLRLSSLKPLASFSASNPAATGDNTDKISEHSSDSSNAGASSGGLIAKFKSLRARDDPTRASSDEAQSSVDGSSSQLLPIIAEKDFTKLGTTVRQIMDHPTLGPKFRDFAKSFHADEGIQFLDELAQASLSTEAPAQICKRLMEKYFLDGAACWVNLPNDIHGDMIECYQNQTYTSVPQLFESAMYETFTDLKKSDTFRKFCLEDREAREFSNGADVVLLDALMLPDRFRTALAEVENDTKLSNLVRFCASVGEFERLADHGSKERKARAQKIASMFVQSGAQFQVDLPQMYRAGIERGNYYEKVLSDAKLECLQVLCKHEGLMTAARKQTVLSRSNSIKMAASPVPMASEETVPLQLLLAEKDGMLGRTLIAKCAAEHMDQSIINKLKFLAATTAYMELPNGTNKNATGRKIISIYIQPGSSFEVADIGLGFVEDLCASNADFTKLLPVVFHNVLADVASKPEVMKLAAAVV